MSRLALPFLSIVVLTGNGCRQPCEGLLECISQSTHNSVVVFAQSESTLAVRTQESAVMTIVGDTLFEDDWTIGFDTDLSDSVVIGTKTGQAFSIPYQVGATSMTDPIWTTSTDNDILMRVGDWWLTTYPNSSTTEAYGSGFLQLEHPDVPNDIVIFGTEPLQQWPAHVFPCGDLDGDDHEDWMAVHLDTKRTGEVRVGLSTRWLNFEGAQNINALPLLTGSLEAEGFGHDILCDRDWTGDGQIDLVVSSPFANVNGVTAAGRIQLFSNDNGAFTKVRSVSGERKHEWLGYRLTAGDITGDGNLELASTAFEATNSTVRLWTWQNSPTNQLRERYTMRSPELESNTFFGYDILIRDINGDGKDDLLIGEPYYDGPKSESGLLTIFKGTDNLLDWNTQYDQIFGSTAYAHLGYSIYTHDLNQDGIQDILLPVIDVN